MPRRWLKRAVKIPEGLGLFSERFSKRFEAPLPSRSLPDPESVRAIEPTYNLAVVLAGSLEDRKQLLLSYLPKVAQWLGPGEIWDRLITPEEWSAFPSDALQALVLLDTSSMPPGAQGFQGTVEEILAQKKGWSIDERLDEWWDGADLGKVRKLMDLLDRKLVSNAAAAARMCKLPARRLADLAADKRVFTFLADEVRKGGVASDWAGELFARTEEAGSIEMARRFLAIPDFLFPKTWRDLPRQVLEPVRIVTRTCHAIWHLSSSQPARISGLRQTRDSISS